MGADHLLVGEAGLPYLVERETDGIDAWLDLMETLEAICPEMPRPEARTWQDYRL